MEIERRVEEINSIFNKNKNIFRLKGKIILQIQLALKINVLLNSQYYIRFHPTKYVMLEIQIPMNIY